MIDPFKGKGSTPSRKRFWNRVSQAVNASRKVAGNSVTVDEHPGKGTVVAALEPPVGIGAGGAGGSQRGGVTPPGGGQGGGGSPPTGACEDPITGHCEITTEADCSGTWHGDGSTCISACCFGDGECIADLPTSACRAAGGMSQSYGTGCDPNLCPVCDPITHYVCRCSDVGGGYVPNPTCCPLENSICLTCYYIVGGLYYCCCCVDLGGGNIGNCIPGG